MKIYGTLITPEITAYSLDEFMNKDIEHFVKRDCVNDILEYIRCKKPDRLLALRGLPHTGQHTILHQVVSELSEEEQKQCMFLEFEKWTENEAAHVLMIIHDAIDEGYRIFFLKNMADNEFYQRVGDVLVDRIEKYNIRIIIYGDNPTSIAFRAGDEEFCNRVQILDYTFICYSTNSLLLSAADPETFVSEENYTDYLRRGPITQRSFSGNVDKVKNYIDSVASDIIQTQSLCDGIYQYRPLLSDTYKDETLVSTLKSVIYKSVTDIAYDAICYAMVEQGTPRRTAEHPLFDKTITDADFLMSKIDAILGITSADVKAEIREHFLVKNAPPLPIFRNDDYLVPNITEFREYEKKELEHVLRELYCLIDYAGMQHCSTDYCTESSNDPCQILGNQHFIFQNTAFVYTLAKDIFLQFQQDEWFQSLEITDENKFWNDCEELLLSRLAVHNIICELNHRSNNYLTKLLVKKVGYYMTINFAVIADKNTHETVPEEHRTMRQIIVGPERHLKNAKNHLDSWTMRKFRDKLAQTIGQSRIEQILCSPADAAHLISRLPDMLGLTAEK